MHPDGSGGLVTVTGPTAVSNLPEYLFETGTIKLWSSPGNLGIRWVEIRVNLNPSSSPFCNSRAFSMYFYFGDGRYPGRSGPANKPDQDTNMALIFSLIG